jgi:hypothetical protein
VVLEMMHGHVTAAILDGAKIKFLSLGNEISSQFFLCKMMSHSSRHPTWLPLDLS